MFSHAFGALRRPRRGYVCLNCLLKDIVNTPPKRRRRNYSTQNAALQDSVLQDCPNGKSALSTRGSSLDPIHLSVESKDRLVKQLEPLDTLQLNHATTSSPNEPKSRANIIENQQASNITLSTPGDNRQNANNHRHGHFKKKNSQEVAHSMGEGKNKNMNRGSKRSRVKTKLMEGKRNATQTSKDSLNAHKNVSKTDPRAKKSSPLRQSIGSMSSAIYAKEEASDSKPSLLIKVLSKKKREPSGIESGIVKKKKTKGLKKGRSPAQERSSERKQKAPGKDKMGSASITGATGKLSISKALSILSSSKKLSSGRGTGESSKILATKLSRPSSKKPSKRDNSSLIITSPVVGGKAFRAGTVGEHLSLEASLGKDSSFSLTNKLEVHSIEASNLEIEPIFTEEGPAVPGLAYGLDRVLFNPGVYQLQDPRSRVYNFDPYLQKIMPVAEFNFSSLQKYITSSKDVVLQSVAQRYGKRYTGSSSSMTSTLAHFHFLLSQWRSPNFSMLSESFPKASKNFTLLQRGPSAAFLRWNGSGYAIDADKEYDTPNVLSMLGKSMEKLLTLETNDFERYRRTNATQISEDEKSAPEAFHYSSMGDFLMRSQLDAYDHRLPGTGMFDLKTRAVVSIRMDVENFEEGMGYEIRQLHGNYESFEREYYDMIRAAFLKYSLQVRMGRMDGIFVAYHNTERIFGFQYVSLPEMDLSLHGTADTLLGDQEFKISVELLNKVLDRVTAKFPQQSVRLHFETRETSTPFMYIFAEPMSEERIERIQNKSQLATQEFERKFFNLDHEKSEGHLSVERPGEDTLLETDWETLRAKVEEEVEMDGRFPNREVVESEDTGLRPKITLGEDPTNSNPKVASLVDLEAMESNSSTLDNAKTTGSEEQADLESEATAGKEAPANTDVDGPIRKEAGSSTRDVATLKMENQDLRALEHDNYSSKHAPEKGLQGYTYTDKISAGTVPAVQNKKLPDSKAEGKDLAGNNSKESLHQGSTPDLFAMTLTVRNRVNGRYVDRPVDLRKGDKWAAEYSLAEVQGVGRSWSLYTASKLRREKALRSNNKDEKQAVSFYTARLRELAQKGKQWRIERDRMDEDKKRSIL